MVLFKGSPRKLTLPMMASYITKKKKSKHLYNKFQISPLTDFSCIAPYLVIPFQPHWPLSGHSPSHHRASPCHRLVPFQTFADVIPSAGRVPSQESTRFISSSCSRSLFSSVSPNYPSASPILLPNILFLVSLF